VQAEDIAAIPRGHSLDERNHDALPCIVIFHAIELPTLDLLRRPAISWKYTGKEDDPANENF
jgi:hypothetical protein